MALNDIKVPKENAQGTFNEIALAASDLKLGTTANLPLKTGTGGVIEAGSFGTAAGSFCEGNDARLSDARTPSSTLAHKASHATGGTDALAPSDIGAQTVFTDEQLTLLSTTRVDLTAARAKIFNVVQYADGTATVRLPSTGSLVGDVFVFRWATGSDTVVIQNSTAPNLPIGTLSSGQQIRFAFAAVGGWVPVAVDTHTHTFGTAAGSFCEGNDARLSDDRDPNLHAASHLPDGADELFDQSLNTDDAPTFGGLISTGTLITASLEIAQQIEIKDGNDYIAAIVAGTDVLTASRNYQLPNASGTIALQGAITTSGLTQATARILGRTTASSGSIEEIQIGSGLSLSAGELSATGGSGVTSVSGTAPIVSSGGTTPAISISAATTSAAGSMSSADKTKLDGIASGAEVNVNADWNASSGDAQILNKPTLGTAAAAATTDFAAASHTHSASAISDSTTAGRALLTAADAAAQRTSLGLAASATTDTTNASNISSGTLAPARMGSGTPSASNYLRGDGSWQTVAAGVGGGTGSTDNSILRSDGTGGSTLQASGLTVTDDFVTFSVTGDAGTDVITATGSAFADGQPIRFLSLTGGTGLTAGTNYFVREVSGATFKVETSIGGGAVNFTTNITAGTLINGHVIQNLVALQNNSSATNSSLVLQTKGTGAFIVSPAIPNGSTEGGNGRGLRAICIQAERTSASTVASANDSIAIGNRVIANGNLGLAIGYAANAGRANSVCIGNQATCSDGFPGDDSIVIGLQSNSRAARQISIGRINSMTNSAGSDSISIQGGSPSAPFTASILGSAATQRGQFSTLPFSSVYWGGATTDATANVELNLDATATNRFVIAASTMVFADIMIAGNSTASGKASFWHYHVAIRRDGSNNTSLVGAAEQIGNTQAFGSPSGWAVSIDADDTNESLRVRVTGEASTNITWRAVAFYRVI